MQTPITLFFLFVWCVFLKPTCISFPPFVLYQNYPRHTLLWWASSMALRRRCSRAPPMLYMPPGRQSSGPRRWTWSGLRRRPVSWLLVCPMAQFIPSPQSICQCGGCHTYHVASPAHTPLLPFLHAAEPYHFSEPPYTELPAAVLATCRLHGLGWRKGDDLRCPVLNPVDGMDLRGAEDLLVAVCHAVTTALVRFPFQSRCPLPPQSHCVIDKLYIFCGRVDGGS